MVQKRIANEKVIVKRLKSIENLGNMDILCTDKTGTITTGELKIHSFLDINGNNNEKVFLYAYLNAIYETGFENPIDKSIKNYKRLDISSDYSKIDEIPYDFIRKRLSIVVSHKDNSLPTNSESRNILITKGALPNVLDICSFVELTDGKIEDVYKLKDKIKDTFKEFGDKGYRVIGIAYKLIEEEKPTRQLSSNPSQSSINGTNTNIHI